MPEESIPSEVGAQKEEQPDFVSFAEYKDQGGEMNEVEYGEVQALMLDEGLSDMLNNGWFELATMVPTRPDVGDRDFYNSTHDEFGPQFGDVYSVIRAKFPDKPKEWIYTQTGFARGGVWH